MKKWLGSSPLGWAAGAAALGLLAWQGHHLAHWLPEFERMIENLGPWGPVVFCLSIVVLGPLLVPDTLFAVTAGTTFGLVEGMLYYFVAVYFMCLCVQWLGSHWLKGRVLRWLEPRRELRAMVTTVRTGGVRLAFLVRLVPVNPALMSYALGAAGVPLRVALPANLAMFAHMFPTVYFGAAAVHVTRMAGAGHAQWETEGVLLLLGLGVCVALALIVTRRALAVIAAEQAASGGPSGG